MFVCILGGRGVYINFQEDSLCYYMYLSINILIVWKIDLWIYFVLMVWYPNKYEKIIKSWIVKLQGDMKHDKKYLEMKAPWYFNISVC